MISFLTSCNVILAEVSFKTCLRFLGRTVVNASQKCYIKIIITDLINKQINLTRLYVLEGSFEIKTKLLGQLLTPA